MAEKKKEEPKQDDHGKRIDAIVELLKANGFSLPKELQ
jgi:hypothetical protein